MSSHANRAGESTRKRDAAHLSDESPLGDHVLRKLLASKRRRQEGLLGCVERTTGAILFAVRHGKISTDALGPVADTLEAVRAAADGDDDGVHMISVSVSLGAPPTPPKSAPVKPLVWWSRKMEPWELVPHKIRAVHRAVQRPEVVAYVNEALAPHCIRFVGAEEDPPRLEVQVWRA